jgi:hypothetical protein
MSESLDWTLSAWETPFGHVQSLAMVSLLDVKGLDIIVQQRRDPARRRWRVSFPPNSVGAYRNMDEAHRPELWGPSPSGWTAIVVDSPWFAEMREPRLFWDPPGEPTAWVHYVLMTEDDCVDILADWPPTVEEIAPATDDDPPPGKSIVYYVPEDNEGVRRLTQLVRQAKLRGVWDKAKRMLRFHQ